jgi:hypothetical protein
MASKEHFIKVKHGSQPTWKSGKTGKRLFFSSQGIWKVCEIREKSGNFVWSDFPDLCREVHTI